MKTEPLQHQHRFESSQPRLFPDYSGKFASNALININTYKSEMAATHRKQLQRLLTLAQEKHRITNIDGLAPFQIIRTYRLYQIDETDIDFFIIGEKRTTLDLSAGRLEAFFRTKSFTSLLGALPKKSSPTLKPQIQAQVEELENFLHQDSKRLETILTDKSKGVAFIEAELTAVCRKLYADYGFCPTIYRDIDIEHHKARILFKIDPETKDEIINVIANFDPESTSFVAVKEVKTLTKFEHFILDLRDRATFEKHDIPIDEKRAASDVEHGTTFLVVFRGKFDEVEPLVMTIHSDKESCFADKETGEKAAEAIEAYLTKALLALKGVEKLSSIKHPAEAMPSIAGMNGSTEGSGIKNSSSEGTPLVLLNQQEQVGLALREAKTWNIATSYRITSTIERLEKDFVLRTPQFGVVLSRDLYLNPKNSLRDEDIETLIEELYPLFVDDWSKVLTNNSLPVFKGMARELLHHWLIEDNPFAFFIWRIKKILYGLEIVNHEGTKIENAVAAVTVSNAEILTNESMRKLLADLNLSEIELQKLPQNVGIIINRFQTTRQIFHNCGLGSLGFRMLGLWWYTMNKKFFNLAISTSRTTSPVGAQGINRRLKHAIPGKPGSKNQDNPNWLFYLATGRYLDNLWGIEDADLVADGKNNGIWVRNAYKYKGLEFDRAKLVHSTHPGIEECFANFGPQDKHYFQDMLLPMGQLGLFVEPTSIYYERLKEFKRGLDIAKRKFALGAMSRMR